MPQRLTPIVVPVCLAGLVSVLFAGYSFATEAHTTSMLLGVAALLAASTLASRYPARIEGPNGGGVSSRSSSRRARSCSSAGTPASSLPSRRPSSSS